MTEGPPFLPFFLPAGQGERFCIYHPAAGEPRGAFVYVHPFAEEMNKSRRMAALQSRRLAAEGYAVLQIDLYGCGDSSGDFSEATWDAWKDDVALAVRWVKREVGAPIHLWGLRLGALLALDQAREAGAYEGCLLWQPVHSGASLITQFLRLRVATGMMADDGKDGKVTTQELRGRLAQGETLEIAGYELTPRLAHAVERLRLADLAPAAGEVRWIEVTPDGDGSLPPASRRIAETWAAQGVEVQTHAVGGETFWSTVEIADNPQLLACTTDAYTQVPA